MGPDIAVNKGRWYLRWDKGEIFQVTEQDTASGEITIRTYDGGIDHLSLDQWRNLRPGPADPPSDWTGPEETMDDLDAEASAPPGYSTAPAVLGSTLKRILVAVKEVGETWSPAVAKATQIASATGAQIELYHCVDAALTLQDLASYENGLDEFERLQRRPWEEGLERLATKVRSHGIHVSFSAPVDHPAHEGILRQARRYHADLIVTDAHVGSNFAPALLEEVDWELVRLSPAPLLIVKRPQPYHHPVVLAAVDPAHAHSKPAALDDRILSQSDLISKALHGDLHAVHVYPVPAAYAQAVAAVTANVAAELQAIEAGSARAALDAVLANRPIPSDHRHVQPGLPADAIITAATRVGASLLVMGSVGRSGLGRLFIGNTAEKVLRRLPCDLLLLKPDGFRNAISDERRGAQIIATGTYY
jgi:universal stress protein E